MPSKVLPKSKIIGLSFNDENPVRSGNSRSAQTHLKGHVVETAFELGWSKLKNGDLLAVAEASFDILITTDQNLRYQQNLSGRNLRIVVIMTTSWPRIQKSIPKILDALDRVVPGEPFEVTP